MASPGYAPRPFIAPSSPGWFETPDPDLVVKLGPDEFSTRSGIPETGWRVGLRRGGLKGWRTYARDNTAVTAHPSGEGQVPGIRTTDARAITIAAVITAATGSGVDDALDELCRRRRVTLTVNDLRRGYSREADVRVIQIQETPIGDGICDITISVVADDSMRFSSERYTLTNGANMMVNRGPATSWPRIDLVGPHGPITIQHSGGILAHPALPSGARRRIDCRNGVALDMPAGARLWGPAAPTGPWPRVAPGGGTWTISGLGAGSASVTRTEAWT